MSTVEEVVLRTIPAPYRATLATFNAVRDFHVRRHWVNFAAQEIVALAAPTTPFSVHRRRCPLCSGSSSSGQVGFAYPDGLFRHLTGTHNARPCLLMAAIDELIAINIGGPSAPNLEAHATLAEHFAQKIAAMQAA